MTLTELMGCSANLDVVDLAQILFPLALRDPSVRFGSQAVILVQNVRVAGYDQERTLSVRQLCCLSQLPNVTFQVAEIARRQSVPLDEHH